MPDTYTNENDQILCRLRVKGAFFLTCGVKQVCMMLSKTINITFGDDLVFKCAICPDPSKRDELLDFYKDQPDCAYCGKNMAIREVPRDVQLLPGELPTKAGTQLCISCYAGAKYQYREEKLKQWQAEFKQLEQDYEDGKIPYAMLVEFENKCKKEDPEASLL